MTCPLDDVFYLRSMFSSLRILHISAKFSALAASQQLVRRNCGTTNAADHKLVPAPPVPLGAGDPSEFATVSVGAILNSVEIPLVPG